MATVTMTLEEYEALRALVQQQTQPAGMVDVVMNDKVMPKKKVNRAYANRYKKAFRKIAPKYKLKSGKWKKNGFKTAVKLAHKEAKR